MLHEEHYISAVHGTGALFVLRSVGNLRKGKEAATNRHWLSFGQNEPELTLFAIGAALHDAFPAVFFALLSSLIRCLEGNSGPTKPCKEGFWIIASKFPHVIPILC
jgi:hypothetical protein